MKGILYVGWAAIFFGCVIAFADAPPNISVKTNKLSSTEVFAQPRTFAELLTLSSAQLEKVDLARIDLLCADGLKGSEDLDLEYCVRTLNGWAEYVKNETARNQHFFEEHPERFKNSLAYYRMAMLATVLCQDLRLQYNPDREKQLENGHTLRSDKDEKEFFANSKDVFIHGLIGGKHFGTCASMPFLYAAIARRLDYPVTLATTATHFYVRYEEKNGKHLNVEATEHRAFLTPSDEEYKNPWEMHLSDNEIAGMRYLQPLNNKEVLGHALLTRATVLRSMKQYDKQAETWATASRYLPDTPMWKQIVHDMLALAKNESEQQRLNARWDRIAQLHIPHGGGFAYFQDKKVRLHWLMNSSLDNVLIEKTLNDFENELRHYTEPFSESGSHSAIQTVGEPEPQISLRYSTVSGKEIKIPADFLPPFERGMIPPDLMQRVANKKLEDGDSILTEFWTYYDEIIQQRNKAVSRQLVENSTGPILIARERVPHEYWDSIPEQLQLRLSGLNNADEIIQEILSFRAGELAQQRDLAEREKQGLYSRYRVRFGREPDVNVPTYLLPPEYRNDMPLELKLRLAGKNDAASIQAEIMRFQLDEQNKRSRENANEVLHPKQRDMGLARIQLVPGAVLNPAMPSEPMPDSPLTPLPTEGINKVGKSGNKP